MRLVALAFLLLLSPLALAEDGPPESPVDRRAGEVAWAVANGDDAALAKLQKDDTPDPWLVCEVLIVTGRREYAEAYAKRLDRYDYVQLSAYVAGRKTHVHDKDRLETLITAQWHSARGAVKKAIEMIDALAVDPKTVTGVLTLYSRASMRVPTRDVATIADRFAAAAEPATVLGWRSKAAFAIQGHGDYLLQMSKYAEGAERLAKAARLQEARGAKREVIRARYMLGHAHTIVGQHAEALSTFGKCLALAKELELVDEIGAALGAIAVIYSREGRPHRAIELKREALAYARKSKDPETIVVSLGNLAVDLMALSKYGEAMPLLEEGLALAEESDLPRHSTWIRSNIATVHRNTGRYAQAMVMFAKVVQEAGAQRNHRVEAHAHMQLSGCYILIDQPKKALPHLRSALALAESVGDMQQAAHIHMNRGTTFSMLGEYAKAREALESSAAIRRGMGDELGALRAEAALAAVFVDEGKSTEAIPFYIRVADALDALNDPGSAARARMKLSQAYLKTDQNEKAKAVLLALVPQVEEMADANLSAVLYFRLAHLSFQAGDYEKTRKYARLALDADRHTWAGLAEEEVARKRADTRVVCTMGADACQSLLDLDGAFAFHEEGRAGAFVEGMKARDAIREMVVPEHLRMEEDAARMAARVAENAVLEAKATGKRKAVRAALKQLEAARAEVVRVVSRIQSQAKVGASLIYPGAIPLAELRKRLAKDQALILFSSYEAESRAVVITRVSYDAFRLGSHADVQAAVEALALDDSSSSPDKAIAALQALTVERMLIPQGIKRLLVSPEGSLCYVPLALVFPNHEVTYVPSGTAYAVLQDMAKGKRGTKVLAVADPAYRGASRVPPSAQRGGLPTRLARLPETRVEAKALGDTVLAGEDATIERLREALKTQERWRAVHFACHGILDAVQPMWSALALSPTGAGVADFLTPIDLLRIPVRADLVVLSACETSRGKVYLGEGVVGLSRAFMYAGSPRILASLWKVDDAATRALMLEFYRLWKSEGVPTAQALRRAQDYVRAQPKWKHPYYWAAWVLWGLPD